MTELKPVRLAEVADVESGAGFPLQYQGKSEEQFPFLKVSDMNLAGNERCIHHWNNSISEHTRIEVRARVFPPGTVIFPKIGAAIATNKKRILTKPSCVDNNVMGAIPKPDALVSEYLYYLLRATDLSQFASASNPPSIRKSEVENWIVPVPALDEQRRIVGLLDRAAEIRRRADAARAKARAIIPALFLDTFGDPATNPNGWPIVELGDVISNITGGKNIESGNGVSKYRILKVSAVTSGIFRSQEAKPAPDNHVPAANHHVRDGHFLFSRANTSELVGAVAIADDVPEGLLLPDKIWRIEWTSARMDLRYAYSLLRSSELRRVFAVIGSGTSGSMKNISQAKLVRVPIPLPPIVLQTAFAEQTQRLESLARHLDAAAAKAEAMAAGLSAEVFGSPASPARRNAA